MGLVRTVEPENLPVTLTDAKKQCELASSDTAHDSHILRLIRAATADVERHTRRALITQTWRLSLPDWPFDRPYYRKYAGAVGRVYLPRPPLLSVSSVVYVNEAGTDVTLSTALYQVTADASPGFIEPAFGEVWPTVRPETVEPVSITYLAGFGDDSSAVPEQYKNVIYELVAFRFMNRGDAQTDIPKHVKWSLNALRCGAQYDYFGVKG